MVDGFLGSGVKFQIAYGLLCIAAIALVGPWLYQTEYVQMKIHQAVCIQRSMTVGAKQGYRIYPDRFYDLAGTEDDPCSKQIVDRINIEIPNVEGREMRINGVPVLSLALLAIRRNSDGTLFRQSSCRYLTCGEFLELWDKMGLAGTDENEED